MLLKGEMSVRPRNHRLAVSQVGPTTCTTVCIGKMTKRDHFTLGQKKTNNQKSVAVVSITWAKVGRFRAVDEDL